MFEEKLWNCTIDGLLAKSGPYLMEQKATIDLIIIFNQLVIQLKIEAVHLSCLSISNQLDQLFFCYKVMIINLLK